MNSFTHETKDTKELDAALSKCQGELRNPAPNRVSHFAKKGANGRPEPDYADLDKVYDTIRESAARHDLSYPFTMETIGDQTLLVLTIAHGKSGQSRRSTLPINANDKPMSFWATMTYHKRGMLCSAFGIAADRDDDGLTADSAHISQDADRTIRAQAMLTEKWNACSTDADREKFRKGSAKTVASGAATQEFVDQLMGHSA